MGDINEMMFGDEHFSQSARLEWQMKAFREAVEDVSFQDLGWSGMAYTWDNRQGGNDNVKARLDRAFANEAFRQRYEDIRVRHISATESDHCFVVTEIHGTRKTDCAHRVKQFRYENVWQTHSDYEKIVTDTWRKQARAPGLQGIVESLGALQKELEPWGAKEFGCLARTVRQLQKKLDKLRRQSIGRGPSDEEKATVIKLREALRQEEVWLRQRSRVLWLRAGDRNTGYFQAQAKQRQRMNKISGLKRADGSVCADEGEDKQEIQAFYQALYTSQGVFDTSELLAHVPVKVTPEMNEMLVKPFEAQEVHDALFQMAPSKAPRVDGFTAGFFQRHWHLLKDDVTNAVLGFLNGGELPTGFNDTSITLIPKIRYPQSISQYRPIALCPVLYKIAAKAITNRMRACMDEIINEEQSAFVPGRLITDNVLVAFESVHTLRRRKKGKNHACAVKLDMLKAYDRVEWHYLEAILQRLGFSPIWIRLIMKCVTSVRFSVRVNGELQPYFTPSRGLRQGDPASPFLFLLSAEGFSSLLKFYGGHIDRGIRASVRSPWVSHLLFADDCLIFLNANSQCAQRLNDILRIYGEASGQSVNKDKSAIFFSPNTPSSIRQNIKGMLGIMVEAFSDRYLGLPTAVGRITSGTFDHISERARSKMQG